MEHEQKRCPVCHAEIPKNSKAIYCCKACSMAAFRRRHSKLVLAEEGLCYYNSEVLCSKKRWQRLSQGETRREAVLPEPG